jgi:TldD protein
LCGETLIKMQSEKQFCENALDLATSKGVQYADIRLIPQSVSEEISVKSGVVENLEYSEMAGFGVRVLLGGVWGFASSFATTEKEVARVVDLAIQIAKASASTKRRETKLAAALIWKDANYISAARIDPFKVSLEEKVDLLVKADQLMKQESKKVKVTEADLSFHRMRKIFASTEGSYITQEIVVSGGGISAKAVEGDEVQIRSYPNSFRGNFATRGYEFIESMELLKHAPRIAREAEELLAAPNCPELETDLILMPSQLCLQIHESIGHASELDRILGTEITYAGGSFLTPLLDQLGSYRYGSALVNITADATLDGGLGTFGFDDEGVEAQKFPLLEQGILKNLLTSRETVTEVNEKLGHDYFKSSNGTMRSSFSNRIPLIRMTNIYMEAGDQELENLIGSTKNGILMDTNFSWSIDDLRKNFNFGVEAAWQIKDGKLGQLYKNSLYTGITPVFWNSCDAVCNSKYWEMYGTPNCGKGQPGQIMSVGHAAAPARFRNVKVGSRKK